MLIADAKGILEWYTLDDFKILIEECKVILSVWDL